MGCFIDAHIHFWDPRARRHQWLEGVPELARRFTPSDIDFGTSVPDGLVFVEADCAAGEVLSEVEWVSSLACGPVPIVGIVAHAPLDHPELVSPLLRRLVDHPLVMGVRRLLQDEPATVLASSALVEGTRLLAEYELTSDLCVTAEQLPAVTKLVRSCPETSFVLDHAAKPPVGDGGLEPWGRDLRRLASCENVSCKFSGLATIAPGAQPADLVPYLRHALDAFGPDRCMFGSDWPVSLQATSYEAWLDVVFETCHDFTSDELDQIFGETAIRVYGLGRPATGEQEPCSQSNT